jgi:hypothetical protein
VRVLVREVTGGVASHVARDLADASGVLVAFTERIGGLSEPPYASLNLAAHVGDDLVHVDANRDRVFEALGVSKLRNRLVTAEQVHGVRIAQVREADAGSGAGAAPGSPPPLPGCDALWTRDAGVPLMLFYADCVPVVLVHAQLRAVAVVHAGWRGALAGIVGDAARAISRESGDPGGIMAFIGPHIGACCYEVGIEIVSQFANRFVTLSRASDRLDLAAVVTEDLVRAGVVEERQWHLGICTAHNTEHFYSYRAEGRTGRHAALAVLLP